MVNSRAREQLVVVKQADETVNNSSSAQADDELFLRTKTGKTYAWKCVLFINSDATPDFKYQFTLNGNTGNKSVTSDNNPNVPMTTADQNASIACLTDGTDQMIVIHGRTISVGGNISLFWAQNTQTVADTKVLKGSYLQAWTT